MSAASCLERAPTRFWRRQTQKPVANPTPKTSLLKSWQRCREELGLEPFWRLDLGNYVLFNCVSTLVALPLFEADLLPAEKPA